MSELDNGIDSYIKQQEKDARDAEKFRSGDIQRKILVGAAVLKQVEVGGFPKAKFLQFMDGALTRAKHRALFGLPKH